MAPTASWTDVLNELNKDVAREQPSDVVQYGADWFQARLKRERAGPTKRGPGMLGNLPSSNLVPSALSPFSETGPADSPFGGRRATIASGSGLFSSPFAAAQEPKEDDGGPNSGPAQSIFSSPFGAPEDHGDEPPIPSYALGRRTSVSAESLVPQNQRKVDTLGSTAEEEEQTPRYPKTEEQLARIKAAIKPNFLFRNLDEEQERDVLAAMKEVNIGAGEMIIEQGAAGDFFYVVEKGTLEIFVRKDGQVVEGDKQLLGKKVATSKEGNSFGELALMHNAPRAASIVSTSPCTLWALDRVSFRTILLDHTSRKRTLYETFLSEVPILASLQPQERAKIADVLESRTFEDGQDVIRQGDEGEEFFLIESGSAVAVKNQDGKESVVKQYTKGDYFGELALLNRQTRAATVRAEGQLRVAALGEAAFTRLLGPVKDIMARNVGERYGMYGAREDLGEDLHFVPHLIMYVPPSKRAGFVPKSSLPPDYRNREGEGWSQYAQGLHFNHPPSSTFTFFGHFPPLERPSRPTYDPTRTADNTPLPPSPIIAPTHPLNHLISFINIFRNAHPDWETAGELWIHTNAEILMEDYGIDEAPGPRKNFGRPIPLFKEGGGGKFTFIGWYQIDKMRVVPPSSDEVRDLLERKDAAKSYRSGRTAEAWATSLAQQWVKLRLSPSPPSSVNYTSLDHPMKLKGGISGEVERYMLKVGGLEEELALSEDKVKI